MQFSSILFLNNHHTVLPAETSLFSDLNLDQIFSAALYHKEEYELTEFFYTPLCTKSEVYYRQKVMQDLVAGHMQSCINIFKEVPDSIFVMNLSLYGFLSVSFYMP